MIPYLLGSGNSAKAILNSLAIIQNIDSDIKIEPIQKLHRNQILADLRPCKDSVLFIANPHGLHAKKIIEADKAGFKNIVTEKPICCSLDELQELSSVKAKVAVLHVYRQTWGIQTLKEIINTGDFGKIICIESRYWQVSSAQRAIQRAISGNPNLNTWKNDFALSGGHDVVLDLVTHWFDLMMFLINSKIKIDKSHFIKSYLNAETPHRDTHCQALLEFESGVTALGSVSKTVHGASNQLELNIIGEKQSAEWRFENPDQIIIGRGNSKFTMIRQNSIIGSGQSAYHATGWLEGYIEIIHQVIKQIDKSTLENIPDLNQSRDNMNYLLQLVKN